MKAILTPLIVRHRAIIGDRLAALQGAGTTIVTTVDIHLPEKGRKQLSGKRPSKSVRYEIFVHYDNFYAKLRTAL